ncbi:unnamed protein product [Brachionus calyciflorus]|uniref:Methionyl-tRNA formyltransferase, mitochondrial n=1 Tax=Brachionus calyciflorus TaxID=104777 RepID=A0A813QZ51_9BILA|nr:unnamed protein product [Brachionus calyciflorus]
MIFDKILKFKKFDYIVSYRRASTSNDKLNVVFFGTDLLSIKILIGLNRLFNDKIINKINVVTSATPSKTTCLITNKTSRTGDLVNFRGNQIIDYCKKNRIDYYKWNDIKTNNEYEHLFKNFDVGVCASFGHLIPSRLINLFPYGIVNVHPSLLPRWRGAAPIIYSILFDDKQVGVSLMKIMPKHFDVGPIFDQKRTPMPPNLTSLMLLDYLGNIGDEMIIDLFKNFDSKINNLKEQSNENVCYAHKITSDMYYLDWANNTISEIDCQYRALHEIKHLKTMLNGHVVKLYEMIKLENNLIQENQTEPGTIKYFKKENFIAIKCKNGYVGFRGIILNKKLTPKDFYNGYMNNRGTVIFESIPTNIKANLDKRKITIK